MLKLKFEYPAPDTSRLAVAKEGAVTQDVPLYCSVSFEKPGLAPPKANAAVCVPAPPKPLLAVFKLPPVVQLVPLYDSVTPETDPVFPPNPKAAV
jgi:hypothetical protein